MSEGTIKIYLIIVIAGGFCGIIAGLVIGFSKQARPPGLRWKTFLRGILTAMAGGCSLTLLILGKLGMWTAFLSVGALLILQEYLLFFVQKVSSRRDHPSELKGK